MKNKVPKSITFMVCLISAFLLTGCKGPSEEKIAAAQEAYRQLIAIHNQTVEAHKTIDDDFLDTELAALLQEVKQLDSYHLNEMEEADIDLLIENMNTMIVSYQACLDKIQDFKEAEKAAALVPVFFTLTNRTDMTFLKLTLYEKGDSSEKTNVLESTEGLIPGQVLTGLTIFRDVANTPWILCLENEAKERCEITLAVKDLKTEGESFFLTCDPETGEIVVEK